MQKQIELGAVIAQRPTIYGYGVESTAPITKGRVVYVHPGRRFFVLEFEALFGTFRESFQLMDA